MLVKQRNKWKAKFENNELPNSVLLDLYRENRNTLEKKIPDIFEEICAYVLYLEKTKKGLVENLNPEMKSKQDYWDNIFKDGSLPKAHVLEDYRVYRNSDNKRTTRIVEELSEYVLYLENINLNL